MFEVTIKEILPNADLLGPKSVDAPTIERYRQTVDVLDIRGVMDAVNRVPRKKRETKADK